ncbi:MAG: ABC transporter permease [Clostridiaceae bacterium]|nr:ABC transporter permease [Clostridiaceae bacterium]
MKLAFRIALRFLKSSKGQTIFIIMGIAVGVSVQIFIGTLIQGLQKSLVDKTIGHSSQVTIVSNLNDKTIDNWQDKVKAVSSYDNRLIAVSPSADQPGFLKLGGKTESVLVRGFQWDNAEKIYSIKNAIYEGDIPKNKNEVIIGKDLRKEINVNKGDTINITAPNGTKADYTITGFFDLGVAPLNKVWILTDIVTVQDNFNIGDKITSIEMQVGENDAFNADKIAGILKTKLNDDTLNVEDWKSQNGQLLSGLSGQGVSSLMIQIFVLISVILGIASVLAISVVQKSKQIGILKAMGIKDKTASGIFLFQGLLLGIVGGSLGIIFGLGLLTGFTKFALNPDGTPVVPLFIDYKFIAISCLIAILSATLAALVPARNSSRLQPMEVIKNG